MHLRLLLLAFSGAISALPLASMGSEASTATVDITKRAEGIPKFHHQLAKYHKTRSDLFERDNEPINSIDIAKRDNQTAVLINIAWY